MQRLRYRNALKDLSQNNAIEVARIIDYYVTYSLVLASIDANRNANIVINWLF